MRHFRQRLLFLGALLACLPALAQNTTARLQGVVRDAQGPLPGVTVTAVNTESGLQRSAVTEAEGSFLIIIPPGPYTVTAGTAAHEEQKASIRLQVGQVIEFNFEEFNWQKHPNKAVLSSRISQCISEARHNGWDPSKRGKPFLYKPDPS